MRPRVAIACALVLAAVSGALALGLTPSAAPSLLASPSGGPGRATPAQERAFGGEPIVISLQGDLASRTLTGQGMMGMLGLESRAAKLPGVRSVYGPATFVNQTVAQIERVVAREIGPIAQRADAAAKRAAERARARGATRQAASQAGERARLDALGTRHARRYSALFARYGALGLPSLTNREFVLGLVFGAHEQPKQRFRWLFPDADHALIIVRPRAGLPDAQLRALGTALTREARRAGLPDGVSAHVGGVPLVVAGVSDSFASELLRLAPVVLLAMALALLIAFRARARRLTLLLPAALAVLATAGASRVLGFGLTPATIAALPVVLGLAVDYAVQLAARYDAERSAGVADDDAGAGRSAASPVDPDAAAARARAAVGPTLLVAAGAMAVGFACLTLSPVPLVDRLGWTLAVGTLIAVAIVLGLGGPLLRYSERRGAPATPPPGRARVAQGSRSATLGALRGRGALAIVGAAAVVAIVGLALSSGTRVQSDIAELAPRGLPELRATKQVERELGVAGTLRIAITGEDVTRPEVVAWQAAVGKRILALDRRLRPGPNLGELLTANADTRPDAASIASLLSLVPRYFLDAVLQRDRTRSELAFSIPVTDVHEQATLLRRIERELARGKPDGVDAQPAGLVALAVASVHDLESGRPLLLLIAALAVFLVLLAIHRRVERALLPIVPALLAAGISAALVRAAGIELSPLGAGLEPLVLAVGVEFGVLLDARFREARAAGAAPAAAATTARRSVGAAVLASAATVALGFAILAASRLELLQQFGILVAVEVTLCAVLAIWLVPGLAAASARRSLRTARRRPAADELDRVETRSASAHERQHANAEPAGVPSS